MERRACIAAFTAAACSLLCAGVASAYTYTYTSVSNTGDGSATVHITQNVSDDSHSTVIINGKNVTPTVAPMSGESEAQLPTFPSGALPQLQSEIKRMVDQVDSNVGTDVHDIGSQINADTHSSQINISQHIETHNGTTSGSTHIFRTKNGSVVEDRTIPVTGTSISAQSTESDALPLLPPPIAIPAPLAPPIMYLPYMGHPFATSSIPRFVAPLFGAASAQIVATTSQNGALIFMTTESSSTPLQDFIASILHVFGL